MAGKESEYNHQFNHEVGDTKTALNTFNPTSNHIRGIKLRDLEQSKKYEVKVNTVINGKTIGSRSEMIEAVINKEDDNDTTKGKIIR